jgi:DNA polymerase-3 subunit delta
MAVLRSGSLDNYLRNPNSGIRAILLYGGDPVAVHETAARIVEAMAESRDDPFAVVGLDGAAISTDPARLLDEVQSLSMTLGRRVVWVRGADQGFLKAMEAVRAAGGIGNLVVAESGELAKTSPLRLRFESWKDAFIIPLYDASGEQAATVIESTMRSAGLVIDAGAVARLIELGGRHGATLAREAEKLALYCAGNGRVTLPDVEALCEDSQWAGFSDVVDAAFEGDLGAVDRLYMQVAAGGADAGRILSAMLAHATRLIELQTEIERGALLDQAIKASRPPLHFGRHASFRSQLLRWPTDALLSAATSLNAAVAHARLRSELAGCIASRTLLAIARNADALRRRMK